MRTITHRDGKAYVADTRVLYTEPVEFTAYYQLRDNIPEGAVASSDDTNSNGCNIFLNGHKLGFSLYVNGKDTLPAWVDEKPISAPKVRKGTQVRWNGSHGCWEKLTKRDGWIAA